MTAPGDPAVGLGPPWSDDVARADQALARFDHTAAGVPDGPLRQRLDGLRDRLSRVAREVTAIAADGQRRSQALAGLGPDRITAELKDARRAQAAAPPGSPLAAAADARVAAAETQHDIVHRLWDGVEETQARLVAALAQLDGLVARAVELSVLGDAAPGAGQTEGELDALVDELEALRAAYDDLGGPPTDPRPGGAT